MKASLEECGGDRRTQLLEVALRLFGDRGVEGTTIKQLAEAAGISTGLLYHYFKGKDDLLSQVIDYRALVLPQLEDLHDQPANEVIPMVVRAICQDLRQNIEIIWIFFREHRTSKTVAQQIERRRQSCIKSLADYLQARQMTGELRAFPAEVAARSLLATLFALHLTETPAEDFIDSFVDLYLRGIKA